MLFLELEFICACWSSTNNLLHNPLLKQLSLMWSRVGQPRSRVAILSLGRKHGADLDVVATVGLLCPWGCEWFSLGGWLACAPPAHVMAFGNLGEEKPYFPCTGPPLILVSQSFSYASCRLLLMPVVVVSVSACWLCGRWSVFYSMWSSDTWSSHIFGWSVIGDPISKSFES